MNFEATTNMAKSVEKTGKPEKSQEELRAILEQKLGSLKPTLQEGIKEYRAALSDGTFEDADGEPAGTGEARKEAMQVRMTTIVDRAEKMRATLDSKETLPQAGDNISINYTYTNPQTNTVEHQETIDLSIETKLTDFISFYKTTSVDLPPDFEDTMRDIWERNFDEIQKSIEENGFNDILIIPSTPDIGDLSKKMKMESGYYDGINSNTTVQTLDGIPFTNQNSDKPRIILYHNRTLPEVQTTTGLDVHLNITAEDAMKLFKQHPDKHMTLPDFLILEAKIFKRSNIHISDWNQKSGQWLNTQSGALLVDSYWNPDNRMLDVDAYASTRQRSRLGVRPSRCFY